ncbi:MAG: GAF domain-containing protein, partial [Thermodesulfobacteriota bacterium]|nr:GAF domain-containing protein [Thermodesulfobacteriota bacterium]
MGKKAKSQVRNERELKYLYFLLKEIMKKDIPLTTDEILNFILEKAINLTKADVGDISILDKQQNELVVYASHGKPIREIFRHSIEEGITGWVAIKKTPSLVGDTQADKRYIVCVQDPEIRSELAVPLLYSGELLGVLNVESKEKKHFTEENLNNLTELSEQLGFFIKFHQEWEALYQRTKHIIFPHNVNELLNIIINGLINLLSVDAITFYPYDQIAQKVPTPPLMAGVFYNKKALWGEFSKENVVGKSLHDKQPHFADDARNDPLMFNKDITPNFIKRENIKSSAVIPLNYEQEIFGILFLNFRYSHSFSQSEMEILPDLAKYISSIAVKLRKIEHKELMTLSSINQAIIGLEDIDKVMELILKEALRMVDEEKTGWAWLYLTDENKGEFKARAFSPLISPEHKERILKEKDNIIGSTANGVIKNIYDLQRLPKEKYVQFIPQARSRIAVPIKSLRENESLGVIVIDSPKTYAFSAYAERLLSVLADQVALAVQSNKLIEKARKQEEVLKRVVKVGAYFERDSGFILKEIAGALN